MKIDYHTKTNLAFLTIKFLCSDEIQIASSIQPAIKIIIHVQTRQTCLLKQSYGKLFFIARTANQVAGPDISYRTMIKPTQQIMKQHFLLLTTLLLSNILYGQKLFDSSKIENHLLTLPKQTGQNSFDINIIKAIEAIDNNYRIITDTLYSYKSLKFTIFQTVLIETNDSVFINPLSLGDRIKTHNFIFNNKYLNFKVDSIAKQLIKSERLKLYSYLAKNFDNFSEEKKNLALSQ